MVDNGIKYVRAIEAKPVTITEHEVILRTNITKVTPAESKHLYRIYRCHEYLFTRGEYFSNEMNALSNSEELLVDQEYRLTMLELASDTTI